MLSNVENRVLAQCDELFDQTLDMTRDLVREYSVLGQESGVLAVMEAWYRRLGLEVERVPLEQTALDFHPKAGPGARPGASGHEGRHNVVARLNPDATSAHLVFNGHLDVVPAEPIDMWTRSPWEPWQQDGWLYGRGAGDMKAGIAAMVMAVHAVRQAGVAIDYPLTLQTVIEEECTGNGALACINRGLAGDFVLIPEPFGTKIVSGQVGVLWFRVSLDGVPAHVLDTSAGSNAIEAIMRLVPAFKTLEERFNAPPRPAPFDTFEHPFNLSIGRIDGGNWASSVPSHAELEGRVGFPPGMTVESVMTQVRECVDQSRELLGGGVTNVRVAFHGFRSEGHLVDLDHRGIRLLDDCHHALTGYAVEHQLLTCTTDLRAFHVAAGVAGTCYGPVAERIHGVDERVDIESIRHTLKAYALFLCRWQQQVVAP